MTTAFAAKTALVDMLASRVPSVDPDPELVVAYSSEWPSGQRPDKCLWAGDIQWLSTEYKTVGGNREEEKFHIALVIENRTPDSTQVELNAWVQTMYAAVEGWLRINRNNPKPIDIPNPITVIPKPQVLAEGPGKPDGTGRSAAMVVLVEFTVRI